MHRNTKRLAAALLAAVLCFAAVPQAHAEPWTYEVDDVMAGYGVEFYPDVGFENPGRNTDAPQEQSSGGSVSAYGGADTGIAVFADDTSTSTGAGYTVTIPAEVNLTETETTKQMEITGTVEPYRVLNVTVGSDDLQLQCGENGEYTIPYTAKWKDSDKTTYTADADETAKDFSAVVDIQLSNVSGAKISGEYTGVLAFTLEAKSKTYTVVYNANGGVGTMDSSVFTCGDTATLAANTYTKADQHFAGWTSTSTACKTHDQVEYADKKAVQMSDFTLQKAADGLNYVVNLYAQWGYLYEVEVDRETVDGTFGEDVAVEHSIILMPYESYSWERPDDYGWETNELRADINGNIVLAWESLEAKVENINQDTKQNYQVKRKRYYIDMNGTCPGEMLNGNLGTIAKAKVYVNGQLASANNGHEDGWVNDFWVQYPWGSSYYIEVELTDKTAYEVSSVTYSTPKTSTDGKIYGKLTGTKLIGSNGSNASTVLVTFKKLTSSTQDDTETALLPSLDETSPVVVDVPTVDTGTDAASTPEPADETPETTPEDQMLWDAGDLATLPDTLQFDDAGFGV